MKLVELLGSPWAIEPASLLEMQGIYETHLRGEKVDIDAIEARLGRPLANEQQTYTLRENGVAVLPIEGVIAPKANLFTRVSGGASAQMLAQQVNSAAVDPRVKALVLQIDSPGGSVFGTPELAQAVREAAGSKPVVAVSDGQLCSAAYWIGSAANAVYVTGPTVQVGSIGIVATHDYSPRAGATRRTEITAGKYKRIASAEQPLSAEGRDYLQAQVDHLYSVFVDAVAESRGVSTDDVLQHMADGRVFIGQQAIDAGLVDGVSTVDALAELLAQEPERFAMRRKAKLRAPSKSASAGAAPKDDPHPVKGEVSMPDVQALTRESLERDHAALFAQVRSEFIALGAANERQRINDVRSAAAMPGHEKLIEQLAMDGKTTGPEAAAVVLAAERNARDAAAKAHAADAPAAVATAAAPQDTELSDDEKVARAHAYAAEHKVDFVAAVKALGYAA